MPSSVDRTRSPDGRPAQPPSPLVIKVSPRFTQWLAEQKLSLAFTTYQSGKLFLIGLQPDGRLSTFERSFRRAMGLWSDGQTLWMATLYQLWRFENSLESGATVNQTFDRLYVPRVGYTTGAVDTHDVGFANGRPVFVATRYSCLAGVSETHSFTPLWQPSFITALRPEDRCHLNGLAMMQGRAAYVTACAQTDTADGWRTERVHGGCVIDVAANEIVCHGLSMPHSPRWHNGRLWILESGRGRFGWVDLSTGRFEPVCFCPGYARGLSLHGNYAVIALSLGREQKSFGDLPLQDTLKSVGAEPICGLIVVDLASGQAVHWFTLQGPVRELYDVITLPGVKQPMALGFKSDEIERTVTLP